MPRGMMAIPRLWRSFILDRQRASYISELQLSLMLCFLASLWLGCEVLFSGCACMVT